MMSIPPHWTILWAAASVGLVGCAEAPVDPSDDLPPASDTPTTPRDEPQAPTDPRFEPMPLAAQTHRVSVALRQQRAEPGAVRQVIDDPSALADHAHDWATSDAFADMVADLWGEVLHTRSVELVMPELGGLIGTSVRDRADSVGKEPLDLIRHVVASGRPFTDIFRFDGTLLTPTGMRIWGGHDGDPSAADGPTPVRWTDGRPAAGVLATHGLWARHVSNGENHHRERAAMLARAFLCTDLGDLDVPIDPDIDLSDNAAVAQAVRTDPACVSCHQTLDPLAAHLWSVFPIPTPGAVLASYEASCNLAGFDACYPVRVWRPALDRLRPLAGLRPPSYWGSASQNLGTLAEHMATDPRFDVCAVRRLAGWMTQTSPNEVPFDQVARWQKAYVDADRDLRALAVTIALDPSFLAEHARDPQDDPLLPGPLMLRPRALSHTIAALTGYRFEVNLRDPACLLTGLNCYGRFDALDDAFLGWHVLAGGTDGARTLHPTLDPTPMTLLAQRAVAEEAAWRVVSTDLEAPADQRRLLRRLADPADPDGARPALADLHLAVLGTPVDEDGPEVDALVDLLDVARTHRSDPARAWADLIATLLRSPDLLFY